MDILPIRQLHTHTQPEPTKALYSKETRNGVTMTAVVRFWNQGDTKQCSRCTVCKADHEHAACLVLVAKHLDAQEALDLRDAHVLKSTSTASQPSSAC